MGFIQTIFLILQAIVLKKIGGESGDSNGAKVLEPLVLAIMKPELLLQISWTGRAGKGKEKKIALQKYGRIMKLITSLCEKADRNYKAAKSTEDLKYKILKYAQAKYGNDTISTGERIDIVTSQMSTANGMNIHAQAPQTFYFTPPNTTFHDNRFYSCDPSVQNSNWQQNADPNYCIDTL